MRTYCTFALMGLVTSLAPPWIETQAPTAWEQDPNAGPMYPCTPAEDLWIKMRTETGEMGIDLAARKLGCTSTYIDPRNTCTQQQLQTLKRFVAKGGKKSHGEFTMECKTAWIPPTRAPTPAPTPTPPTPIVPTPSPTATPTQKPTPTSEYLASHSLLHGEYCIPDDTPVELGKKKFNNPWGICCSKGRTYFKWDTFVSGQLYCGVDKGEKSSCVPDLHMALNGKACCSGKRHYRVDYVKIHRTGWWCGGNVVKDKGQLLTPSVAVDCRMNQWNCPKTCPKSCGGSVYVCSRSVRIQPKDGGARCPPSSKIVKCNTHSCPVDCKQHDTRSCSECTRSCGIGSHICARKTQVKATFGGKQCLPTFFTKSCSARKNCPVDCTVNPWPTWGECTRSCGAGRSMRYRTVARSAAYGGKACPVLHAAKACNTHQCPLDCILTPWTPWSSCTKSCAVGITKSSRRVVREATFGGKQCSAGTSKQQYCNAFACKLPTCHQDLVACKYVPKLRHIVVLHQKTNTAGGTFHCHRTGIQKCVTQPASLYAGSENTCSRSRGQPASWDSACKCVCSKHQCCSRKGYTLDNTELIGNTYHGIADKGDCCSKCTNNPLCSAWEFRHIRMQGHTDIYNLRGTCVLKTGVPSYRFNRAFGPTGKGKCIFPNQKDCLETWSGSRSSSISEKCQLPFISTSSFAENYSA